MLSGVLVSVKSTFWWCRSDRVTYQHTHTDTFIRGSSIDEWEGIDRSMEDVSSPHPHPTTPQTQYITYD